MKVSELMAGYTPSDDFAGFATNDDWVLAVGINLEEAATEKDYTVVQMGIAGLDPQMNPVTQNKQYIRTGLSTSKTGTQRTFAITGMLTASCMPRIILGSLIRATPPAARMSAGMRSKAMTAAAPACSAIRACSGVVTSIITPPFSI